MVEIKFFRKKEQPPIQSPFVYIENGSEVRLPVGMAKSLGCVAQGEKDVRTITILPQSQNLTIDIVWNDGSFRKGAKWGVVAINREEPEKVEFTTTLSHTLLDDRREEGKWITGSDVRFSTDLKRLQGSDWAIEYRPL